MPGVVRKPIDAGVPGLEPAGKKVDAEEKTVHFGKQGNHEATERAERTPVAKCSRLEEAVGEHDEHGRIDEHQAPKAVSSGFTGHERRSSLRATVAYGR